MKIAGTGLMCTLTGLSQRVTPYKIRAQYQSKETDVGILCVYTSMSCYPMDGFMNHSTDKKQNQV